MFTFSKIVDSFLNAEMVPIGSVRGLTAGNGYFLKCGYQGLCIPHHGKCIQICLSFEVAHEETENVSKIDQKDQNGYETEEGGCYFRLVETGGMDELVYRLGV